MPIKLKVTKNDDGEPADYLFEQDRITIGRGRENDLTLPDQKVSTEHAEIRNDDGTYRLVDRDSKNHTFVDGERVGETTPYTLSSGDVFRVGDYEVEFAPLFMPSSEQTTYAPDDEDANPFGKHARQLAAALEGLAETYAFAPPSERDEPLAAALDEHLDPAVGQEEAVQRLIEVLGAADEPVSTGDHAPQPSSPADGAATASVVDALLGSVARMISIPDHFWREFTGSDLDHPPEKQRLYDADPDDLRDHLLGEALSDDDRSERLRHLSEAVDSLVIHNMAMLASYKKAVRAGSKEILRRVNPTDAQQEAEEGGAVVDSFFGGSSTAAIERLEARWAELVEKEWGNLESELFRPTYIDAYLDRMAQTWDLDRADVLRESDA